MTLIPIPNTRSRLGESPFWHPDEQVLYWVDIPGRAIRRLDDNGRVSSWAMPSEPGCIAPTRDGRLIVALRDGAYCFSPIDVHLELLAPAPYDTTRFRFNDGRCDPAGRFFAGTLSEARRQPDAQLYVLLRGRNPADQHASSQNWHWQARAGGVMTANGLAFSPDARHAWWADTRAHRIDRFDYDIDSGQLSNRQLFLQFDARASADDPAAYGGRPDGAAVDEEGGYWCAMYEGARVLRILPDGRIDRQITLPARCPTMVCLGGADRRTLYVTTAREGRAPGELSVEPHAGSVFRMRVDVPGLAVNFFG